MKVRLNKPIRLVLVVLILAAGFWTQYQDNQKTGSAAVNTNLSNPQDYMDDAMRLQRA
jgi:lipopolysaccharide export system protein LptC